MLRDTFAVELLLAGVPIDQVSLLLGHSSVKVTEKHYAPFVKARQEQLETSVKLSWQAQREWLNESAPEATRVN
jgi:integrase/recombinase XerD